ncbi:uncharacterized protein JCM10292_002723 [Rhodotorula paludigena]|uniref:uncharacterized protein n=1 Tax=Rhodotorula paludigena TaxID=86838 RepID=UPI003174D1F3
MGSKDDSAGALASQPREDDRLASPDPAMAEKRTGTPADDGVAVDEVFGEQQGDDVVQFRSLGWSGAAVLIAKSQIGLGVLSIPSVFSTIGLVPGIIVILAMAVITTWTLLVVGDFKLRHPEVYSLSDCGQLIFGRVGAEIFGFAYFLLTTMIAGLGLLSLSTALNAISLHATCTAVFVAVAVVATYPFASFRKLENVAWITWIGLFSIIVAVLVVTIAVGAGTRPAPAPKTGPLDIELVVFGKPTFAAAMNAVANVLAAYGGGPAAMPIVSEMREPRYFPRAVVLCQSLVTAFYLAVGIVVYVYAGQYVASPALGTAGVLIKRVAYGLALPGLLVSSILFTHLPAKWVFVRLLRNSRHLNHATKTHWAVWLSCTLACLLFSYVIASAIPVFGGLVGLASALFGTLMSLHAEAFMHLYDVRHHFASRDGRPRFFWLGVASSVFVLLVGSLILVGGTYGSITSIIDDYSSSGGRPWTCADNSGSV